MVDVNALAMPVPTLYGHAQPRIAPPTPAKSDLKGLRDISLELGITLLPWQETAGRYMEAVGPDGRHLYREYAEVVARQNGKTEKLVPLIVKRLRAGRRIMHTAQNRELPREVFARVADIMSQDQTLFAERNGRTVMPRFANGQEEIRLANGGHYRIVAPTRGGARGPSNDDVIVDEVRELDSWEFIAAAKPTMTASNDPQIIYLSNMGDEDSIVLNSIRERAAEDPQLAYLEWSAAPDREADDAEGWAEANPSIGHFPMILDYLAGEYRANRLGGTLAIFETEHLCRSVTTRMDPLVSMAAWNDREATELQAPLRPSLGVAMDPFGRRASAALAWRQEDAIALTLLYDVPGHPVDADALGKDVSEDARQRGVITTGFDPLTDAQLARFFIRKESISAGIYANASARFVSLIETGNLIWHDAAPVGADLSWTTRKTHEGSFQAVAASDQHPITAVRAAIRAVWLASEPPRVTGPQQPSVMGF